MSKDDKNSGMSRAIRFARRICSVVLLGTIATVGLCFFGAFKLGASQTVATAILYGHVHFTSSDAPDSRFVDPGRFSFRARLPGVAANGSAAPTGWFGYCTSRAFSAVGWCSTQVMLVKIQPEDPVEPSRIAERVKENSFGDFPSWSRANSPARPEDDSYPYVAEYAFGWPERALMFEVGYDHRTRSAQVHNAVPFHLIDRVSGRASLRAGDETLYPLRPIFRGFLVDLLVLGVIADRIVAWLIRPPARWFAHRIRWVSRERLKDSGLCPNCRYPIKGTATCPECGWENTATAASPIRVTSPEQPARAATSD